ncbi:hypothetical protein Sango_0374100 [Sesamum angolense]|uniref:Integrase catalytic domain-containing protein n=1 Tax=Sesamum angolense TaxID=2727404 RepID=A0AAE2C3Q7_9LAMI|nr:hypothetical protein Sango_0374100 [Sesamum angolense]
MRGLNLLKIQMQIEIIKEKVKRRLAPESQVSDDGTLYLKDFVARCLNCQKIKAEHQRPGEWLQPLEILKWKWEHITMDFVIGLLRTQQGHDSIWVIADRLTKSTHFIPVRTTYTLDKLAAIYIEDIVRLHGIPVGIVSDRDPRFTS